MYAEGGGGLVGGLGVEGRKGAGWEQSMRLSKYILLGPLSGYAPFNFRRPELATYLFSYYHSSVNN